MFRSIKYISHFISVARTLAKHDALFLIDGLAENHSLLRIMQKLLLVSASNNKSKGLSKGKRLANALHSLGPAYIKLGQTIATRPDLIGEEIAEDLSELQDRLPSFCGAEVKKIIEKEFGKPLSELFSEFDENAIAAASIAQVHFATTLEGHKVAVKVLRPDIEKAFQKNIQSFIWAALFLENNSSEAKRLRPVEIVKTLEDSVAFEMDLRLEAAAASELQENMKNYEGYRVPNINWQKPSRRILTLERITGTPIGDNKKLKEKGHDLQKLSQKIIHIFLSQSIGGGFFHADLHQGNLFVEDDGTIVPVDFGIMGRLDKNSRRFLAEILWGFQERDYQKVAQVHFDAGYVDKTHSVVLFAQAMRAVAEPIMDKPITEVSIGQLLAQLLKTTRRFSMKTQPQLLMLQRSMVMAEGLAFRLNKEANIWDLSRPTLERWVKQNLSPENQAREIKNTLIRIIKKLPAYLEGLEGHLTNFNLKPELPTPHSKFENIGWGSLIIGFVIGLSLFFIFG